MGALASQTLSYAVANIQKHYGPHLVIILETTHNKWMLSCGLIFGGRLVLRLPLRRQHNLQHALQHEGDIFIQRVVRFRGKPQCLSDQRDVNGVDLKVAIRF